MNDEFMYRRIESYLLRQMTEEERISFEAELLTNEQLAMQLDQQKLEHKTMEAIVEKDLLKDLKKWQAEEEDQVITGIVTSIKVPFYRHPVFIAILIGLLILTLVLIWFNQKNGSEPILPVEQEEIEVQDVERKIASPLDSEETQVKEEDHIEKNERQPLQIDDSKKQLQNERQPDEDYIALVDSFINTDESAILTDQIVVVEQQIADSQLKQDSFINIDESAILTDQIVVPGQQIADSQLKADSFINIDESIIPTDQIAIAEPQISDSQLKDSIVRNKSFTTIKGEMLDERTNEALIGANIIVKGTASGTITDYDGAFEIKTDQSFPLTLSISYIGYTDKDIVVSAADKRVVVKLSENAITTEVIEVKGSRISDKQKESPLTIESMDILAIKETPNVSFYDGLGALKGVDLTTASLGFTIVNTRGFNSTSPVRSLQIIDGVDNQSPGLNFSLGNFVGSPELDVLKVDLIVGASSAYFGPNAFNGVIDMRTKNPFYHKGLSAMVKAGERNLYEVAFRYADAFKNKKGEEKFAFKINFAYMQANDWEATNYDPSFQSEEGRDNPGGYDAVNIYGDENTDGSRDFTEPVLRFEYPGMGFFYRNGYQEIDLVDYDTRNIKANMALHYRIWDDVELIAGINYGEGTTVYQGDNRFSLKGLKFYQGKLELQKPNKFFIRAYRTSEDAGESYDAYLTALLLQNATKENKDWTNNYTTYWRTFIRPRVEALEGYPDPTSFPFDFEAQEIVLAQNQDSLISWSRETQSVVNQTDNIFGKPFLEPGTPEFEAEFNRITSTLPSDPDNPGTRFYDRSALTHVHGEYKFTPVFGDIVVGANYRQYNPDSRGTIFLDTMGRKITNWEYGVYAGFEKKFANNKFKLNITSRLDKNQNFEPLVSPAASLVYKPNENQYLRFSFSSAIRNPTLTDQYLNYNVGRAILLGNIDGVDSLVALKPLFDFAATRNPDTLVYFNEPGIQPEKVKTFEIGYRATLFDKIWVDAGYYFSFYDDFIGYKIGADLFFDEATNIIRDVQVFRVSANAQNRVTTQGFSIGVNYFFPKYLVLAANYSWNVLNKTGTDDPIIPAYNTPEHKYNISLSGRDMKLNIGNTTIRNFGFSINYKWVQGFIFEGSPQFTGPIPTYDLLDAQINYNFKKINTTLKIGASNLLDKKQFQVYGGPRVGRLAYISLLYEWVKK
jgi:iron complex outermembrane recepter protein